MSTSKYTEIIEIEIDDLPPDHLLTTVAQLLNSDQLRSQIPNVVAPLLVRQMVDLPAHLQVALQLPNTVIQNLPAPEQ